MLQTKKWSLSASTLRVMAMVGMLLDHAWATVVPGNLWMHYVGRIVFPIYAFQAAEGFLHTSNRKRYIKRLLLLALIAEIPFNLMQTYSPIFPFHQNTVFTLLLGVLAISALDWHRGTRSVRFMALRMGALFLIFILSIIGFVDYGFFGVLTVVAFYLFRNFRGARLCQLAALVLLNIVFFKGESIVLPLFGAEYWFPIQGFAVLALLPIWLYRGEKGFGGKKFQFAAYAFYPLHMLALYAIAALA